MSDQEKKYHNRDALVHELKKRPPQTPDEMAVLKDECQVFGSVIHGGKAVEIRWERGRGWYWAFKEGKNGVITADQNDAERYGLGYCGGVMTHEESHVLLSRPDVFTKEEWEQRGFGEGYNWVEDCRIEFNPDLVVKDGKEWVKYHLDVDAAPGGGLDYKQANPAGPLSAPQQKIGYIPKHMVFGAAMRQYFYHREYTGQLNDPQAVTEFIDDLAQISPEVAEAFKRVRSHFEQYYQTIPGHLYPTEEEVMEKARESGQIYRDYIWPEYQQLIDQAYDEHTLQKFIQDLLDGSEFSGEGEGGTVIIIDFDSLPEDIQQEIKEKMGGGTSGGQTSQGAKPGEQPGAGEAAGGESAGGDSAGGESSGGETASGQAETGPGQAGGGGNYQDLSERAQQAVKDAFNQVDQEQQQQVATAADSEMDQVSADVSQTLQGNSDQTNSTRPTPSQAAQQGGENDDSNSDKSDSATPSQSPDDEAEQSDDEGGEHATDQVADQGEAKPDQTEAGEESPSEEVGGQSPPASTNQGQTTPLPHQDLPPEEKARLDEFNQNLHRKTEANRNLTTYDRRQIKVKSIINTLKFNLRDKFDPNIEPEEIYEQTGDRFDYQRRLEEKTGQENHERRYYAVEQDEVKRNYRFTILIDLSGSMAAHIEEVFDMIVILCETLSYLGIDFEIQGFAEPLGGYSHFIFKEFDPGNVYFEGKLQIKDKQLVGQIPDQIDGGTPTSKAIVNTANRILKTKATDDEAYQDFLLVFTDGRPTDSVKPQLESTQSAQFVVESVRQAAADNEHDLAVLGFGIGANTDFVANIFGQLPHDLRVVIARELTRYRRQQSGSTTAQVEVKPDNVSNAYDTAAELSHVLPMIFEYMLDNWEEFK